MQGCNPGLVVARAAIIAGAQVRNNGDADTCTLWATFADRGLGYSAVQGTTGRNDNDEAFDTHPDCLRGFEGVAAGPALTTVGAGSPVGLRFSADNGYRGLHVATKNSPCTRQVDCQTLKTVTPGQTAITPRPVPVPAVTRGGAPLSVDAAGVYHYPWQTDDAWGDSCREFVLTAKTGAQHGALFRLLAATHADTGASPTTVLNYANPVANDAVTLAFRQAIAASDALRTGSYSKTLTLTLSTTEP